MSQFSELQFPYKISTFLDDRDKKNPLLFSNSFTKQTDTCFFSVNSMMIEKIARKFVANGKVMCGRVEGTSHRGTQQRATFPTSKQKQRSSPRYQPTKLLDECSTGIFRCKSIQHLSQRHKKSDVENASLRTKGEEKQYGERVRQVKTKHLYHWYFIWYLRPTAEWGKNA